MLSNELNRLIKGGFEEARCKQACPAGIDVPQYIRAIRQGDFTKALRVIREKVPFPSVLGYVCPAFCEMRCRRAEVDESVSINALKRFVAERGQKITEAKPNKPSGKRVAIIGSGPAGLTAAYYLTKVCSYEVTVFEAQAKAGGMMQWGIPAYRLPKEVLEEEIESIVKLGVEIKTNTTIKSVDSLFKQAFDAIFIAIGAWRSIKLGIKGENLPGVMDGLSFLKEVNAGERVKIGDKVAVIGGGNVAIDAARAARRLGARTVDIIYRRGRMEMPADPDQIDQALEEGINIMFLSVPSKITRKGEKLRIELARMELLGIGDSRKREVQGITGHEGALDFDSLIVAIGERAEMPPELGVLTMQDGNISVDPVTLATNRPGVFAGGDVVTGPATVIEAIAAGRKAAASIDRFLGGQGRIDESLVPTEEDMGQAWDEGILEIPRQRMPLQDDTKRIKNFDCVEVGFTEERARAEAERCLRCDQRLIIEINLSNCIECYMCQTMCSLTYQHACNPEKGRIIVGRLPRSIHYNNECIGGCALCTNYCPTDAISLSEQKLVAKVES